MKASYVLIPKLITPVIDTGKSAKIEIYISGHGKITENKLAIMYPATNFVDSEKKGLLTSGIGVMRKKETQEIIGPIAGKEFAEKDVPDTCFVPEPEGVIVILNEGNFMEFRGLSGFPSNGFPIIMGERKHDDIPPLSLSIPISTNARRGDYLIHLALSYSDGEEVATDYKTLSVHVTDWTEKYGKWLAIAGIVGTAATVLSLLTLF